MNPPFFRTDRALIYAPCHRRPDVDSHVEWLGDKEVVKYSEQRHLNHNCETQWRYIKGFDNITSYFWEIAQRHSEYDHPIGTITASIDLYNGIADVGIMIGNKHMWGCGYGTDAWSVVCNWLLNDRKLRKVEAGTMEPNKGMLAIFYRTGMKVEGIKLNHFMLSGKPQNMVIAGRFR